MLGSAFRLTERLSKGKALKDRKQALPVDVQGTSLAGVGGTSAAKRKKILHRTQQLSGSMPLNTVASRPRANPPPPPAKSAFGGTDKLGTTYAARDRKQQPRQQVRRGASAGGQVGPTMRDAFGTNFSNSDTKSRGRGAGVLEEVFGGDPVGNAPQVRSKSTGRSSGAARSSSERLTGVLGGKRHGPALRSVQTRGSTGGDPSKRWWDHGDDDDYVPPGSASRTRRNSGSSGRAHVEDSPGKKRRKELEVKGKNSDEAIMLSSSDEEEAEAADEYSFPLDERNQLYFGRFSAAADAPKVEFTRVGLRLPTPSIWGRGIPDADLVPYDDIASLQYITADGVPFVSATLKGGSRPSSLISSCTNLFRPADKIRGGIDHPSESRILIPLGDGTKFQSCVARIRELLPADRKKELLKPMNYAIATNLLENTVYSRMSTRHEAKRPRRANASSGAAADQETMAFYPEQGKDRVKITRADYNLLDEMEMVNDTVIDFYFKWIEKQLLFEDIARKFLFFSTFFYKKLLNIKNDKNDMLKPLQQTERFGVKDGVQIWDRQYLFVPINESFHWSMAVICIDPPAPLISSGGGGGDSRSGGDENDDEAGSKAPAEPGGLSTAAVPKVTILYFDSLGHRGTAHCNNLIRYLNYEWNRQRETGIADKDKTSWPYEISRGGGGRRRSGGSSKGVEQPEQQLPERLAVAQLAKKCPNQKNGHDCGMFVLEYAERFVKDLEFRTRWPAAAAAPAVLPSTDECTFRANETVLRRGSHHGIRRAGFVPAGEEDTLEPSSAAETSSDATVPAVPDAEQACLTYVQQSDFRSWFHNSAVQDKRISMKAIIEKLANVEQPAFPVARMQLIWLRMAGQDKPSGLRKRAIPFTCRDSATFLMSLVTAFLQDIDDFRTTEDDTAELWKVHADKPAVGVKLDLEQSPAANLLRTGDILEVRSASYEARQHAAKAKLAAEAKAKKEAEFEAKRLERAENAKAQQDKKRQRTAEREARLAARAAEPESSSQEMSSQEVEMDEGRSEPPRRSGRSSGISAAAEQHESKPPQVEGARADSELGDAEDPPWVHEQTQKKRECEGERGQFVSARGRKPSKLKLSSKRIPKKKPAAAGGAAAGAIEEEAKTCQQPAATSTSEPQQKQVYHNYVGDAGSSSCEEQEETQAETQARRKPTGGEQARKHDVRASASAAEREWDDGAAEGLAAIQDRFPLDDEAGAPEAELSQEEKDAQFARELQAIDNAAGLGGRRSSRRS